MSDLFSAETIAAVTGVQPATLRKWVERGHVLKVGRDRYDGESVIAHWRAVTTSAPVRDASGRFIGRDTVQP